MRCAKLKRDVNADGIAVIDTATLKLSKLLKSGSDPEQFDISHDGKQLFIANEDSGTLTVVNISTGAIDKSVPVGKQPEGVRVTPDGRWIVVTSEEGNAIYVVDPHSFNVVKSVTVGKRPRDVAFAPDGKTAYISGEFDSSVYTTTIPEAAKRNSGVTAAKRSSPDGCDFRRAAQALVRQHGARRYGGGCGARCRSEVGYRNSGRRASMGYCAVARWETTLQRKRLFERCEHRRYSNFAGHQESRCGQVTLGGRARPLVN